MRVGTIHAICMSPGKGTPKNPRERAVLVAGHGLEGDAHAGDWHRQVSILPLERIEEFRCRGAKVAFGDFGENLVVSGLRWQDIRPGDRMRCGDAVLEITQLGKECHDHCHIHQTMGDCIMPRHGLFARVLRGGKIVVGDEAALQPAFRVALLTVSDKGSAGERKDASGDAMRELVEAAGMVVAARDIVPDEAEQIADRLARYCDEDGVALILTSGGTGFARRDVTPEATLRVVERLCPGIPEAMRSLSLEISKRAMLSRAVAGIRGGTLIVNLPGSPRAVRECLGFVLEDVLHGLEILTGRDGECAR